MNIFALSYAKVFFLEIMYDGTNYHGWQVQPNSDTVQEQVENSLSTILGQNKSVMGAGRTDTGVHAKQFLHILTMTQIF